MLLICRRKVAVDIARTAIESPAIPDAENVNKLLEYISPLIKDESDPTPEQQLDEVCVFALNVNQS